MTYLSDEFLDDQHLFSAGQHVENGTYREVETDRVVVLTQPGHLPPSQNGKVASYVRIRYTWHETQAAQRSKGG